MGNILKIWGVLRAKALISLLFLNSAALAGVQFERLENLPESLKANLTSQSFGSRVSELDFSQIKLNLNGSDRFSIELPGALRVYQQQMPVVPSVTHFIPRQEGYEAEVLLKVEKVEQSVGAIPLVKTPIPLWGEDLNFPAPTEGLFPGSFLKVVPSDKNTVAQIFPVQHNLGTGVTYLLKKASLWVRYIPKVISISGLQTSEGLIVTTKTLQASAEKLAAVQRNFHRVNSQIVFVEDLKEAESVSEEDLPDGYKNIENRDTVIHKYEAETGKGYDYELAKKITHYLQKRILAPGSQLRYVTILGNAEQVPPSYYFTLKAFHGMNKWGVTDQCYGSVNKCQQPRVALGRLPLSNEREVDAYLVKAKTYAAKKDAVSSELSLVAGKAFPNAEVYIGELGSLRTINDPSTNWVGVDKFFRTKFKYTPRDILPIATGGNQSRFVYALDHGKGNQWFVEHEYFTSEDISEAPSVENPNHPVVVSIACSNAAFDQTLTKEPIFANPRFGNESVGVTFLKAKGGPIAYWGEARPGLGSPVYEFDTHGNLDLKGSSYGIQLLEGLFERYHNKGKGRLGDFVLLAQRKFALENGNDMAEQGNAWSYFITTLLGDPTLTLPDRPDVGAENYALGFSATAFEISAGGRRHPFHQFVGPEEFALNFTAPGAVDATLFQWLESEFGSFMAEHVIEERFGIQGDVSINLGFKDEDSLGTYFLRLENKVGVPRERQVWFNVLPQE